jgi:hypothetical protein
MGEVRHELSREAVERLLDGDGGAPVALERMVAAARCAALPGELAGEEAAVAAFRGVGLPFPSGGPRRRSAAKAVIARAVAVVAAVAAASGLGVAAATGALPAGPFHLGRMPASPDVPVASPRPSPAGPTRPGPDPATRGLGIPGAAAVPDTGGPTGTVPPPGATAGLVMLCRAYLAMSPDDAARALGTPPFEALVTQAGGASDVDAFCAALLASPTVADSTPAAATEQHEGTQGRPTPRPKATKSPDADTTAP